MQFLILYANSAHTIIAYSLHLYKRKFIIFGGLAQVCNYDYLKPYRQYKLTFKREKIILFPQRNYIWQLLPKTG